MQQKEPFALYFQHLAQCWVVEEQFYPAACEGPSYNGALSKQEKMAKFVIFL